MRLPTASSLARAAACPGSMALPWITETTTWADRGTSLHSFVAEALCHGVDDALGSVEPKARARYEAVDLAGIAALVGGEPEAEVAFAWDPESDAAMLLGSMLERDYSAAPEGWLVGTADIAVRHGDAAIVADIKGGFQSVPHPSRNPQLRFQALAAARAFGCDEAEAHVIRIGDDGEHAVLTGRFDAIGLDAIAAELRGVIARVAAARDDPASHVAVGPHCNYCPAFAACPAQRDTALALIDHDAAAIGPADARKAWDMLQAVKIAARRVEASLKQYLARHPIPLDDGRELRLVKQERDEVDPAVALRVVEEMFGREAAVKAAGVSKASLQRSAPKGQAAALMRAIKDAGGIGTTEVEAVREVEASRELAAIADEEAS